MNIRHGVMAAAVALFAAFQPSLSMASSPAANPDKTSYTVENINDAVVELKTSLGDIKVELFNDMPRHRDNFLKLVNDGVYDGVLFHRVINDFMVQTGDPKSKSASPGQPLGDGDLGYTIEAEIDYPRHYHKYGALAAARQGDAVNPEKRSSASQFYIVTGHKFSIPQIEAMMRRNPAKVMPQNVVDDYVNLGGTPHLDGGYTVFGQVVDGMDVVEKIQKAETDPYDRPREDIRIISAKVINPAKTN